MHAETGLRNDRAETLATRLANGFRPSGVAGDEESAARLPKIVKHSA